MRSFIPSSERPSAYSRKNQQDAGFDSWMKPSRGPSYQSIEMTWTTSMDDGSLDASSVPERLIGVRGTVGPHSAPPHSCSCVMRLRRAGSSGSSLTYRRLLMPRIRPGPANRAERCREDGGTRSACRERTRRRLCALLRQTFPGTSPLPLAALRRGRTHRPSG